MKKLIYLVTRSDLGGAQRYILDLAKNFKNQYDITVIVGGKNQDCEFIKTLEQEKIRYTFAFHLKKTISPYSSIRAFFEIKKILLNYQPDIIHITNFKASFIGSLAIKNIKKNFIPLIVYTPHGWAFNRLDGRLKSRFYLWAEKKTANIKNRIICVNRVDYEIAKKTLKIDPRKLYLIYNAFDIGQYQYLSKQQAKEKLFSNIPNAKIPSEKTLLIGSVGNLYRTKGYYYLIKALHYLIIDYGYPITAVIIGEGPEKNDLEQRIIKFHPMDYTAMDGEVSNKIILAGKIEKAAELLPAFDFYVSTTLKEGFPYTILEAMGAGLPIFATKVGGIPDLIKDGENGFLIETRNSKDLARKISDLIKNSKLKQAVREKALFDAQNRFGFNKMIEETKKAYEH